MRVVYLRSVNSLCPGLFVGRSVGWSVGSSVLIISKQSAGKLTSSYRRTYKEGGEKMGEGQGQYVDGDGEAKRGWDRLRRENYCIWGGEGGRV